MRIFHVDAFTDRAFTGNPATVVLDADEADDELLAAIAREFASAETAFVLAPDAPDHDLRLRFFNARKEAPFVGHATIAAHAVLAALGLRAEGTLRQKSGTGIIDVRAGRARDGAPLEIEFRQGAPTFAAPLEDAERREVAAALGLRAEQLDRELPAVIAHKGSSRLLLPVRDARVLESIEPQAERLLELGARLGTEGFFAFAVAAERPVRHTDARMFCPALGIPEDPVSGNAHAMLAALLWDRRRLDMTNPTFVGRQGHRMGRPGRVHVGLDVDAQGPAPSRMAAARIGGEAVIISAGDLA